jgi:hypothetical protein
MAYLVIDAAVARPKMPRSLFCATLKLIVLPLLKPSAVMFAAL